MFLTFSLLKALESEREYDIVAIPNRNCLDASVDAAAGVPMLRSAANGDATTLGWG